MTLVSEKANSGTICAIHCLNFVSKCVYALSDQAIRLMPESAVDNFSQLSFLLRFVRLSLHPQLLKRIKPKHYLRSHF